MKTRTTALSVAIGLAVGSVTFASTAIAEESQEQAQELQKLKVTGSRITRASMEGSTPVAVIGEAEIARAGDVSIADVLRKSSYNSFGSHSERSGSSGQSQATMSLRGLGSVRTLVLVNGKRLPGSAALGGGAANINAIPAASVERIEIMADGGSAVYGSDAVAGVVNIILKDSIDGLNVTFGGGIPDREGGDEKNVSISGGTSGSDGSLMFTFEHDSKDEIYLRDRDFLRSKNTDAASFDDMRGVSVYGRNVFHDGSIKPIAGTENNGECKDGFAGEAIYPGLGTVCGYDYTSEAAKTASLERNTLFVNGDLALTDSTTFTSQLLINRNESFGRFAPAAGTFSVDPTTTGGAQFFTDNGLDPADGPATVYYRFDKVGTRDNTVTDFQADLNFALDGYFATEAVGEVIWETGYHTNYSQSSETGTGYVFKSPAEQLANDGEFVDGEFTDEAADVLSATTSRDTEMEMHQFTGGLQFDVAEIGGINVPLYLGSEFTSYEYSDTYDSQSEAGNIIGSAGNSAAGDRETFALFAESVLYLTDDLEMNLAARYDDYSDFGSEISPKISFRYQPQDNLMFRAGAGMGFRAPTLSDLYAADSQSSDYAKDYVSCEANGTADADCPERQYDVIRKSNKDLDAEESVSFNFGVSYSPLENLDLVADYYNVSIEDTIVLNTLQSMIDEARSSGKPNPNITRQGGKIVSADAEWLNLGTLDTSGIDLKANYAHDLNIGSVRYDFSGTYVLDYSEPEFVNGPVNNQVGRNGLPKYRFQSGVGFNYIDTHDIYLSADYIDSQAQDIDKDYNETGHITSQTTWNLAYTYQAPWDGQLSAGVRNLTDEDPSFESDGVTYDEDLYSIQGRVFFFKYSQNF
ncbi:TonB-dependent receptor [Salinivibrio sp. HTSP]|uniref:TonB-dependent receptor plug domain-containing protein n=1 Tax=Salinivibrio sp. HTSP TaxID=2115977 RepID=UPI000E30E9C7|nr:TonB-dependent receptor [Salinivibrio sp. HTSP]